MSPRPLCDGCGAPSDCRSRYTGEALCLACEADLGRLEREVAEGRADWLRAGALPVAPRSRDHSDWLHRAAEALLDAEADE